MVVVISEGGGGPRKRERTERRRPCHTSLSVVCRKTIVPLFLLDFWVILVRFLVLWVSRFTLKTGLAQPFGATLAHVSILDRVRKQGRKTKETGNEREKNRRRERGTEGER